MRERASLWKTAKEYPFALMLTKGRMQRSSISGRCMVSIKTLTLQLLESCLNGHQGAGLINTWFGQQPENRQKCCNVPDRRVGITVII